MTATRVGFIGLGVMGSAECANLLAKSGSPVTVFDIDPEKVAALVERGATAAPSVAAVAAASDVVFLSLPGGPQVEAVVVGDGGLAEHLRPGQIVVDLSTTPVSLVRDLSARLAARGGVFVDAPVARTRQAAIEGTLSIMVGCDDADTFHAIEPLLCCMASEVTLCGPTGAGALVKILNNMVVFETVVALAEAITVARRSGLVTDQVLFDTFAKSSAASFALSHHGMKALLPDEHPSGMFSSRYMLKDLRYAMDVGEQVGARMAGAALAVKLLEETIAAGFGDSYHTAVVRVIEGA